MQQAQGARHSYGGQGGTSTRFGCSAGFQQAWDDVVSAGCEGFEARGQGCRARSVAKSGSACAYTCKLEGRILVSTNEMGGWAGAEREGMG